MCYNMDKLDVYKKPEKTVYGFWFHLYRILKNANWFTVIADQCLPGDWGEGSIGQKDLQTGENFLKQ